jgi:2-oxoglutarate dehydrogenase E1 component
MEQLLADGVIDATFVKGLEQEYKSNFKFKKNQDLTIITPFMKNGGKF